MTKKFKFLGGLFFSFLFCAFIYSELYKYIRLGDFMVALMIAGFLWSKIGWLFQSKKNFKDK